MEHEIKLCSAPEPGFWRQAWENCKPLLVLLALLALLLLGAFFASSCGLVQREQPISDKAGAPLYANEGEKATTEKYDAAGNERARATVPVSTGNVEQATQTAGSFTGMLPGPFGFVAEGILGAITLGTALALRAARKKRLEEYGLTEDEIVEDPQLRAKVEARASHEVKQRIATAAKKRKALPTGTPG